MGIYLNPKNDGFMQAVCSEIYVDKTGLIAYTNRYLNTEQRFICVSRPRRFGKSMALSMLTAYYSRGCDSKELFAGRKIENDPDFEKHLKCSLRTKDDVLTLLIHLGYLAYDSAKEEAFIPNREIIREFENAMSVGGWPEIMRMLRASEKLLEDTLRCDAASVAKGLGRAHMEAASILSYNDENSLSCAIGLAYYSARKDYKLIRELPAGRSFADVVFLPLFSAGKPALIVELKYDKSADTAIRQIKDRQYIQALEGYSGEILLVGINYDRDDRNKPHRCIIEKLAYGVTG